MRDSGASGSETGDPLDNGRNTEYVHSQVRRAILWGDLEAGTAISQVQLAKRLNVSRTPLREALRLLEREGLVVAEPNHRVRVSEVSVVDLEHLYAIRISLETLAIKATLPLLTKRDFGELARIHESMEQLARAEDFEEWEVNNRAFHEKLTKCGGTRLVRMIAQLSDHAERYRRLYQAEMPRAFALGLQEHAEILEACVERDSALAAQRLASHYAKVTLNLISTLAPEHEPTLLRSSLRSVSPATDGSVSRE